MSVRGFQVFGIDSHFVQVGKQLFTESTDLSLDVGFIQATRYNKHFIRLPIMVHNECVARTPCPRVPPVAPDIEPPLYASSRVQEYLHLVHGA